MARIRGRIPALLTLAGLALLVLINPVSMRAQAVAGARIHGTVTDPSGAAVPNAKVIAMQTQTNLVRTTFSGSEGTYALPDLPVGPYRLEVQASGFQTWVQTGIVLQVNDNPAIDVRLPLGQVVQQVEIQANANMVQTQETSTSQVVDQARMMDLPLNGRVATQLVMLAGAANDILSLSPQANYNLTGSKSYYSADSISVAGGEANGTNYLLDGGTHMDAFTGVNLPLPLPDALQEFSVQTSTVWARYGMGPGATVNAVTKSGTNRFHGDAFEFVRNGDFNARDFFAAKQDTLKRNQFGGTIGGPVLKDKLFFFFGYQDTRVRTAPPSTISFVPTSAVLTGDFSTLESATCQSSGKPRTITNPSTGQVFANDFVSPTLFNQQALNILKYVPAASNPCGKVTYAIPAPTGESQYVGRVDWNQSAKHNFFGRYFLADYALPGQYSSSNILLTTQAGILDRAQSMVVGDTYSLSPTAVNSAHITFTRMAITRGASPAVPNFNAVGVNIYQTDPNFMELGVTGYFSIGCGTCATAWFRQGEFQFADDLDITHGRHDITVGGEWVHYRFDFDNLSNGNGDFSFNGGFSGDGLLDFMLGLPSSLSDSDPQLYDSRHNYIGMYAQDNVRLAKRLNVQLGLRWEPYLPSREIGNRMQHFNETAFMAGEVSTQFVNAPPGLFFPGDPGIPTNVTYSQLRNLEPRVGLTWDPTGSGRQAIRAGYGLIYDPITTENFPERPTGDAPWSNNITLAPPAGLTNPFAAYPGGNPFPLPSPPSKNFVFPSEASYYNLPVNVSTLYVQQWSFSYQVQLSKGWLLSANYIGNKTTHIWTGEDQDAAVYIPGTCNGAPCSTISNTNQRRVLYLLNPVTGAKYSNVYHLDDGANAEYNGLMVKAERRFQQHYTVLTNYTYSHCISEWDSNGDFGSYMQNPNDRNASRGNCSYNLLHVFNLSLVAETPRFANRRTNWLVGNWQLSPIFSLHSGLWSYPLVGVDNSRSGTGIDRPNAVPGVDPYEENMSTLQWLNPAAFTPNAIGTFGNVGRNSLVGPGYFDIDAEVSRYFNFTEKQRLELRFEFFNLTNHPNFRLPNLTESSATFGEIQSDVSPRILQFGLRYTF